MTRARACLVIGVPSLLVASIAIAQETTGQLEGRALDAEGKPIPYVNVLAAGPALQGARGCLGGKNGTFVLLAMPVGTYSIRISHVAYEGETLENVRVQLGQTTMLGDVQLQSRELMTKKVVVTGKTPLLDPTSTEVGGVLSERSYSTLPIERDYRSIAVLLPQANGSFFGDEMTVAGATGLENRYFIDGTDVTDASRGTTGTRLPYNFVQEVEVRTGGYEAEYRSSLGGTINAITYSGGNEVKGQVFGFYTNSGLAAEPLQEAGSLDRGDFAYYDVGIGLGGPLRKDRLWYHVAYNPTFRREEVGIPGQGLFDDQTTIHSFAGKLTWRTHPGNTLILTALGDPTVQEGVRKSWIGNPLKLANPDPWLRDSRAGGVDLVLEDRYLVRDNLLLQGSLSWATRSEQSLPATQRGADDLFFADEETGVWSGGSFAKRIDNSSTVVMAGLKCNWRPARHEVKSGLAYKYSRLRFDEVHEGLIRYSSTSYNLWHGTSNGAVANHILSLYLQDSWHLAARLRLNAGLRVDGLLITDTSGHVAQTDLDQVQPRVGFVWQPGRSLAHKVSGSYGRFYHDLATYPVSWVYSSGVWLVPQREVRKGSRSGTPRAARTSASALQGQKVAEAGWGNSGRGRAENHTGPGPERFAPRTPLRSPAL